MSENNKTVYRFYLCEPTPPYREKSHGMDSPPLTMSFQEMTRSFLEGIGSAIC